MTYTATVESGSVEVTKALSVSAAGAGNVAFKLESADSAPVTVSVTEALPGLKDVQVPAMDGGEWSVSGSTVEFAQTLGPGDTESTMCRFHTDDPDAVADAVRPPRVRVQQPADRDDDEPTTDATGGFEFGRTSPATDGSAQPLIDRTINGRSDDAGSRAPDDARVTADGGTALNRATDETEFSMPDDEYSTAELVTAEETPDRRDG
ncbi:hypothetical protein [Halovivax gelatinilyticus]|uniref:hypothetical protein n=1 Tax=Halovivax gelatinilyticus TaxID=2961597 RepID=UPI0020CA8985|nr:hypothetical protein [Halovivax gelatinilyticus]